MNPAGAVRLHVLCDVVAPFPEPVERMFPGWTPEYAAWTADQASGNRTDDGQWLLHVHVFVLETSTGLVVVDLGVGGPGAAGADWLGRPGRLPRLLAGIGVDPADVSLVVLTHAHADHVGWSLDEDGRPRFGRAEYVVQRAELDAVKDAPAYRTVLCPLESAGRVRVVDGDVRLVPGVRLVHAPGHTPGQQVVVTGDAVVGGDVFVHPAQVPWPDLAYAYDADPEEAVAARRRLLRLAADRGLLLRAAHFHAPARPDGLSA